MLHTVGGQQPQEQVDLQCSTAYLAEVNAGFSDPTLVEGQRKHLEWLRDLLVDPANPDYADQVSVVPIILSTSIQHCTTTCVTFTCLYM